MPRLTCPTATGRALLRLACCWLAALLAVQGLAASHGRGLGPLHRHPAVAQVAAVPAGEGRDADHAQVHRQGERHHHGPGAGDHQLLADPAADGAAGLLAAAGAQLSGSWSGLGPLAVPAWRDALPGFLESAWGSHLAAPPHAPPRHA